MDGDQDPKETLGEAHTPRDPARPVEPDPERAAKIGDTAATAQAALDDLAGLIDQDEAADQLSLLDDEECLFAGPVAHVAETFQAAKGRGRPKGSKNKANQLFRDFLLKQGYRHPGLNLADMANADPDKLARQLGGYRETADGKIVYVACSPKEAFEMIMKANTILMEYFESKRPAETVHTEKTLGVMVFQQLDSSGRQAPGGVISLTGTVRESDDETKA